MVDEDDVLAWFNGDYFQIMKNWFAAWLEIVVVLLMPGAFALAQNTDADEEFSFNNETTCHGVNVAIESHCGKKSERGINYTCTYQTISLTQSDGKSISKDLLEKEKLDNYHIATSLRCVSAKTKPYLFILFDNGGSCDDCEVAALMDMKGKWIFYGSLWLVSGNEKKEIKRSRGAWLKAAELRILDKAVENE